MRPPKIPRPVDDGPSKTQLKKEMQDLQDLGETLTTLSKDQLDQLELPEFLRDALDELENVGKHEAKRRHMPVSYTHLDVYKRQERGCVAFDGGAD